MTRDLTQGSISKGIFLFALPCVLGNLLQNLYNLVDTAVVGRLISTASLTAVGATGSLVALFTNSIAGLMSGFGIVAGRKYGSKDESALKKVFVNALIISSVSAILFSVVGVFFAEKMLCLLQTPPELMDEATVYLSVVMGGLFTTVFYNFYCEMLRAVGNSRTPLLFLLAASVLHILLAIFFLSVCRMGVLGAALATVISQAFSVVLCVICTYRTIPNFRIKVKDIKLEKNTVAECLKIGIPTMMTNFIVAFGVIILQFVTNGIGVEYVTAYSCASRIGYLLSTPITGYSVALSVFVAQNRGAGKPDRIRKGIRVTNLTLFLINVILCVTVFAASRRMLEFLITDGDKAVTAGVNYLYVRSVAMFVLAVGSCYKSILNALEKPLFPLISGFLEIAVRYAAPFLLVANGFGFMSIPLTDAISWIVIAVFLLFAYFHETKRNGDDTVEKQSV